MADSKPPEITIEGENCPEAVLEWHRLTSLPDYKRQCTLSRDLSLQAKKHLRYLGWNFWHVNKQGRWEMRYTSPVTGKNYISLTKACQGCIEEGGCNLQQDQQPAEKKIRKPRKSKEKGKLKKRQTIDDDDAYNDAGEGLGEGSISACGSRRGRSLRTTKRLMRAASLPPPSSESSQHNHETAIHSLIDGNVVPLHSLVFCRGANNVVKKGKLQRTGISCDCCGELFSLSHFEAHAAGCYTHTPSASIFLQDGRSLLDCQNQALNSDPKMDSLELPKVERDLPPYQNENICFLCRYGGELVLCDGCPSSFHLCCVGLDHVPDGDWFCPACSCKICKQRYANDCADNRLLVCFQCERKYHTDCLKGQGFTRVESWFCNETCMNICFGLQNLVGRTIYVVGTNNNLTWRLLKSVKSGRCGESQLSWDKGEGLSQNESKLSVALSVLHESFDRVIHPFTGRDMIEDVVLSRFSELNRLNCHGFYTVVLEKGEQVVSVATIRIFGKRVAEIPFVATRMQFRRQGMCGVMMSMIESMLTYLGVEEIVLPSSQNAIGTWTKTFGFGTMTLPVKSQLVDYVFLDFADIIMCHKVLVKQFVT